ncbi:hypothetical protein ACFSKI_19020 [Pseudogracilibacillus auburnensis]|uniref:Uncharacterized protein n=1 Tax=Pseudogracilibacillus auburnensis TaxID=1494959 RepID=A0A2V3W6L8_9BACI|nr:hypothetical protein [Pseudogracilibacillus auburnensis]PXW88788.1 hypothetical protein DFR56_103294 [Pseudogracilibacillus auburnensis]
MEQTHIYDYLGAIEDPIFNKISNLEVGKVVDLGGVTVLLNQFGLYEVETGISHDCFRSKKQVYEGVSKYFSLIIW